MDRKEATKKNAKGRRLLNKGQYDEAIKLFSGAIEIDPKREAAWRNRSEANRKLGRKVQADFDKLEAEKLRKAARKGRKKWKIGSGELTWKEFFFFMGLIVGTGLVIISVALLTIPTWLRLVLIFAVLPASYVGVLGSGKYWLRIPFFTALGILVIYTIIRVILRNID